MLSLCYELPTPLCSVQSCSSKTICSTKLITNAELASTFNMAIEPQEGASVGLCKQHYQKMYKFLHQRVPCKSCGAMPNDTEHFPYHCPHPVIINRYLEDKGDTSALDPTHWICGAYYKFFCAIVKKKSLSSVMLGLKR